MRGERGQATSDYVAVVLVVAVVAAGVATAAATIGGAPIAGAVQRQMARALCVVGRGNCDVDRLPCVVAQRRTVNGLTVTLAIVQLGHDRAVLREERSDGTVAVTLIDRAKPGARGGFGVRGKLSLAGRNLTLGGEVSAAAVALFGTGRVWILPNGRAADALIERARGVRPSQLRPLRPRRNGRPAGRGAPLPPADQTFDDHGLSVSGRATLTGAGASVEAEDVFGTRTDRRSGQVTAYVRRRNALAGSLATSSRGGDWSEEYAITFDRDGRPIDLVVLTSATSTKSRLVGARAPKKKDASGSAGVRKGTGLVSTTETHLDLTDPDNLAVAQAFLSQVRSPSPGLGDVVKVSDALRRLLDERGVIHARTLEVDQDGIALGGRVGLGVQIGADFERSVETTRLVEASTRGIDGVWRERADCLARAHEGTA